LADKFDNDANTAIASKCIQFEDCWNHLV
jgi:hypothetical protein